MDRQFAPVLHLLLFSFPLAFLRSFGPLESSSHFRWDKGWLHPSYVIQWIIAVKAFHFVMQEGLPFCLAVNG